MKKRMKKVLAVILAATAVLSGCGADKGGSDSADKEVTLDIFTTQDRTTTRLYNEENIKAFEEKYDNIKVELQVVPDNQYVTLLQTKLATGDVPDLIHYNWESANSLQYDKNFEKLDDQDWAKRLKNPEKLMLPINGKAENIYMFAPDIPIEAVGIVYNKKIFEQVGITEVPRTYDELLAACDKIKAAGITPFFVPGKDSWTIQTWQTAAVGDFIKNIDPEIMNDINSGKKSWTDFKEFEEINSKFKGLVEKGYTNENILADDFNKAQEEFIAGNYAMISMGDFFIDVVKGLDESVDASIFPIPWRDNADLATGQASGFLVPTAGENKEEAKLFLEFLSQPEQLERMQQTAPYITNFVDGPEGELSSHQVDEKVYIDAGKTCQQLNDYLLVDNTELWKLYQDMMGGQKDAKDVANEWDSVFKQLMQDKGMDGF